MFPSSTHGASLVVPGFPDVCKTPIGLLPVPMPYPLLSGECLLRQIKGRDGSRKTLSMSSMSSQSSGNVARLGDATLRSASRVQQLRSRLQAITVQLIGMQGTDPNQWHRLVDEYVLVTAELYLALAPQ